MTHLIRRIEELSFNAWPCLQTRFYDGWVLRFAKGYTRRANSINPVYHSSLDLEAKIDTCEMIYGDAGLPTIFKLTPVSYPTGLDGILAGRGYRKEAPTSVQIVDLDALDAGTANGVVCENTLNSVWLEHFVRLSKLSHRHGETLRRMLEYVMPQQCFAMVYHEDHPAAVGMAVHDDAFVGLFDIVTDENLRNRGLGRQVTTHLLKWGQDNGAKQAYLQVMTDNGPANHLYQGFGFREVYQYWYRIKDTAG